MTEDEERRVCENLARVRALAAKRASIATGGEGAVDGDGACGHRLFGRSGGRCSCKCREG